jgi:hypothetical protein
MAGVSKWVWGKPHPTLVMASLPVQCNACLVASLANIGKEPLGEHGGITWYIEIANAETYRVVHILRSCPARLRLINGARYHHLPTTSLRTLDSGRHVLVCGIVEAQTHEQADSDDCEEVDKRDIAPVDSVPR